MRNIDNVRAILAIIVRSEAPSANHCSPALALHQPISIASHTLESAHKSHRIVETDQYHVRELANDKRAIQIHNIIGVVACVCVSVFIVWLFVRFSLAARNYTIFYMHCTRAPCTNSYALGVLAVRR